MVESVKKKEKHMFFSNPPMTLPVICFRHLFGWDFRHQLGELVFLKGKSLMKPSLNGWTHARKQVLKNQQPWKDKWQTNMTHLTNPPWRMVSPIKKLGDWNQQKKSHVKAMHWPCIWRVFFFIKFHRSWEAHFFRAPWSYPKWAPGNISWESKGTQYHPPP